MVVFFPTLDYPEKTKHNIFKILKQVPFNRPRCNIEILGGIHRSHFNATFPDLYWLRVHVYKKKRGWWTKIINSAHIFLRYRIGENRYIVPPPHPDDSYVPDTSRVPDGEWEFFDYTLRP